MEVLFKILQDYGNNFDTLFWTMIFQSIFKPLFSELSFTFQSKKSKEMNWLR